MNRLYIAVIFSVSTLFLAGTANALRVEPSIILASSPDKVYYGSTLFYCYDNRLIIPANARYDKQTMSDMANLSRRLGWRNVYVLSSRHQYGMPSSSKYYAKKYFRRHGVTYHYYYPPQRYHQTHRVPYGYQERNYSQRRSYGYNRGYSSRRNNNSGFYFRFSF